MSEKDYRYEDDPAAAKPGEIEVADLRHSRGLSEEEPAESAPDPAPAPAPEPPAPPAAPPAASVAEAPEVENEIGMPDEAGAGASEQEDAGAAFEMEQLRLLFGGGLGAYLRSQLGLLFNFALISLGRMPNPATGIVSADMDKARIAIDVFEVIVAKLQPELAPEEREQMVNLVAELKYVYMQLTQGVPPPAAPA